MLLRSVLNALIWTSLTIVTLRAAERKYTEENKELSLKLLTLSAMAYYDNPAHCMEKTLNENRGQVIDGLKIVGTFRAELDGHILSALIGVSDEKRKTVMAFRGTTNYRQLCQEILQTPMALPNEPRTHHPYFENAYREMKDAGQFLTKYTKGRRSEYDVILTGHSLGGALATMTARDLVAEGHISKDKLSLYTFGMPCVGNQAQAEDNQHHVPNSFHLINIYDCVPSMPPFPCYQHPGHKIYVDDKGNQKPQDERNKEERKGILQSCVDSIKEKCSDTMQATADALGTVWNGPAHHTSYFGIHVGGYCEQRSLGWFEFDAAFEGDSSNAGYADSIFNRDEF